MPIVRPAFLISILLTSLAAEVVAFSFKELAGKWCGENTNYTFGKDSLTVTFHDGRPTRRFKVTRYEDLGQTVKMHWVNNKEDLFTDFSEFSADGRAMAQQKNDAGPRRPFRRCK